MGIALGIVLVALALAVVAFPFIRSRRYASPPDPELERLQAARRRIYRQFDELNADLASGELSAEEHAAQSAELRMEAARALRDLSTMETDPADEEELEREIAAARRMAAEGRKEGQPAAGPGERS